MSRSTVPSYSRAPRIPTNLPAPKDAPRPTRAQALLEYGLFGVFGLMVLVAILAVIFASSETHRTVPNQIAAGVAADRVNVLLVIAASQKPRASTEALMLVSLKPSTGDVAVISVPSDLWVRMGRYGTRRLSSAGAVGSTSGYPGRGPGLMSDTVSQILGQPVHAYVRSTPETLTRLVDAAGGIELNVTRGVLDTRTGDRFYRGRQRLTGAQVARYALSERIAGSANDRFVREARQRDVLAAILSRSPETFPSRTRALTAGLTTNLQPAQLVWLRDRVAGRTARTITLAPYVDVFQVATVVDRGEALRPRVGDFHQLQHIAANVFSQSLH